VALRLHSRLVALNVVALTATALLLGYFLSSNVKKAFETEIEDQLFKTATLARIYLREQPPTADTQDLVTAISRLLDVRVTLIAADGGVLGDSDISRGGLSALENHRTRPEFIEALANGRGTSVRQSSTLGISFIYVATTMDDGSVLRVAMPLSTVETLLSGLRRQLILAMFVGVGLSLAFGYMVFAVVSRPLKRVAEASQQLAVGNLEAEIPVAGDRDLATVGSSLNAMAKSLRLKMSELEGDKHRTEAVIAAMSAGVIVFNQQARIVLANQSIRMLLDLHGESAGRRPMEIVRDPMLEHVVLAALQGAEPAAIELTTGKGKVLLAHTAPVRALNGAVELAVVVFHDLTEIRRTEKMRKDFVANVSHEFKTPLTSIMGYAETLLSMEGEDAEVRREFLAAIERNGMLLRGLVDDLLVLASLEGEFPLEKSRFNAEDLIKEQIQSKEPLFTSRNLQVKLNCAHFEIEADQVRLMRALSNLLDNAAQYNRPGGEVRVSTSTTKSHFRIDVEDTGGGIPQAELARVFERFYRIDKSRTRESGGTGLGLAIARHAVESQGGTLTVTSKLGVGSTFTILLPFS
jgi:two-component system, OmpR family, phosphate regulon sensor histidine kinase PhoR